MEKGFSLNHSLNSTQRSGERNEKRAPIQWKDRWLHSMPSVMVRDLHTGTWNTQRRLGEIKEWREDLNMDALKDMSGFLITKGEVMKSEGIAGK